MSRHARIEIVPETRLVTRPAHRIRRVLRRQARRDTIRARENMLKATAWLDEIEPGEDLPGPRRERHGVRLWAVSVTRTVVADSGWTSARELPIFYLDPNVQGITSAEHAKSIAEDVLQQPNDRRCTVLTNIHVEPIY